MIVNELYVEGALSLYCLDLKQKDFFGIIMRWEINIKCSKKGLHGAR